jgi:hypothetical protein
MIRTSAHSAGGTSLLQCGSSTRRCRSRSEQGQARSRWVPGLCCFQCGCLGSCVRAGCCFAAAARAGAREQTGQITGPQPLDEGAPRRSAISQDFSSRRAMDPGSFHDLGRHQGHQLLAARTGAVREASVAEGRDARRDRRRDPLLVSCAGLTKVVDAIDVILDLGLPASGAPRASGASWAQRRRMGQPSSRWVSVASVDEVSAGGALHVVAGTLRSRVRGTVHAVDHCCPHKLGAAREGPGAGNGRHLSRGWVHLGTGGPSTIPARG